MKIDDIVKGVNTELAGELLAYNDIVLFLDEVIDDINNALDSTYPTFSEFTYTDYPEHYPNYDFFPDRYIRSVVIKGCAYKYFVMDEEGIQTAQQYGYNYQDNLFRMTRDFIEQVPEEFQALNTGGVQDLSDVAYIEPWVRNGAL